MKMTRKLKREAMKEYNPFKDVLKVLKHYFPDLMTLISLIDDPRNQSYITYSQEEFIMMSMFSKFTHMKSRRHMNECFNNETIIHNFKILFDEKLEEVPHGDTIHNYFKNVSIEQMRQILYGMFKDLLQKKIIDNYRVEDEYYHLVIDGVNMHSYSTKHVEGCLQRQHRSQEITYHSDALVGVIVMGNVIIPLDFEMIENGNLIYSKQDCEINAAKRMLERIKKNFKRLKICVSGDALYFGEPMFELINKNNWKYLITFKEGCSKDVCEYYEAAKQGEDTIKHEKTRGKEKVRYEYYNGIRYKEREMNIVELVIGDKDKFSYITDIKIKEKNYKEIIEKGRERWKIENKGFNDLKNHGYEMKHALSYDENGMKANFIIMMISQLVMQLLEHYEKTKGCFETIRKMGEDIKEALRNAILSAQDIREIATSFYISRLIPY